MAVMRDPERLVVLGPGASNKPLVGCASVGPAAGGRDAHAAMHAPPRPSCAAAAAPAAGMLRPHPPPPRPPRVRAAAAGAHLHRRRRPAGLLPVGWRPARRLGLERRAGAGHGGRQGPGEQAEQALVRWQALPACRPGSPWGAPPQPAARRGAAPAHQLPAPRPQVHFYTQHGTKLARELSFGKAVEQEGVSHCVIWGDGLLVVSAVSHSIWAAVGLKEPRALRLPALPDADAQPPQCVAVIEPNHTVSGGLEVGDWWCSPRRQPPCPPQPTRGGSRCSAYCSAHVAWQHPHGWRAHRGPGRLPWTGTTRCLHGSRATHGCLRWCQLLGVAGGAGAGGGWRGRAAVGD
jgi:hypothetical protein